MGINPNLCAINSSCNTLVLFSISTRSIDNVGTSAIITLLNELATEVSTLDSLKIVFSGVDSRISINGWLMLSVAKFIFLLVVNFFFRVKSSLYSLTFVNAVNWTQVMKVGWR